MPTIRVLHCNTSADEGWTADSPDLKGWSVAGASYAETRTRAEEAVREQLPDDSAEVEITHHIACMRR
jgi:predicted RNase H-like HicB family nuclease